MRCFKNKVLLAAVFFVLTALIGCSKPEEKAAVPVVNVACNLPMTGPFGIYGQTVRDGALLAIDDLKNRKTNVKINMDIQDNAGKPGTTASIMQKQFLGPVDIYVSGVKPQTMAIFDEVAKKGVPHFVWVFDAFICAQNQNTFRTWVSFKFEPVKYLQYIDYKKPGKIAIAYPQLPHVDEEFTKIVIPKLLERGYSRDDIFVEVFEWDQKDFKNVMAKIKEFGPDLTILSGFQGNIAAMIKLAKSYNMVHDGNFIGTYDTMDAATVLSSKEIEGIRLVAPSYSLDEKNAPLDAWKDRFRAKYNREPLYTDAYSYDMVQIIADAASRVKPPSASSQEWSNALAATNIDGVTGKLSFDKDGDLEVSLVIGVFKDGKILLDESDSQ